LTDGRNTAVGAAAQVEARAKINLFLRVLGRREDGYHDLETLIAPISLADRLEIHAAADPSAFRTMSLSLRVVGEAALVAGVPVDDSNLVLRAASALAERTGVRGFADIVVEKRVPAAGGLGGGSADAAAVLRTLNQLWSCGLGTDGLVEVAATVGSDVPALLFEGGSLARGRGERVEPLVVPTLDVVLATFDFGVHTADAFRWWDEDGAVTGPPIDSVLGALGRPQEPSDAFARSLSNDLEPCVIARNPRIGEVKDELLSAGAAGVVMSGSGPSLAAIASPAGGRFGQDVEQRVERLAGRPLRSVTTGGA
jgi:4-diphosphocytidyl-2-C-methyl-D-erythritol kinase